MTWPDTLTIEIPFDVADQACNQLAALIGDEPGPLAELFDVLTEEVVAAMAQGVMPLDDGADTRGADDFAARYAANVAAGILEP